MTKEDYRVFIALLAYALLPLTCWGIGELLIKAFTP